MKSQRRQRMEDMLKNAIVTNDNDLLGKGLLELEAYLWAKGTVHLTTYAHQLPTYLAEVAVDRTLDIIEEKLRLGKFSSGAHVVNSARVTLIGQRDDSGKFIRTGILLKAINQERARMQAERDPTIAESLQRHPFTLEEIIERRSVLKAYVPRFEQTAMSLCRNPESCKLYQALAALFKVAVDECTADRVSFDSLRVFQPIRDQKEHSHKAFQLNPDISFFLQRFMDLPQNNLSKLCDRNALTLFQITDGLPDLLGVTDKLLARYKKKFARRMDELKAEVENAKTLNAILWVIEQKFSEFKQDIVKIKCLRLFNEENGRYVLKSRVSAALQERLNVCQENIPSMVEKVRPYLSQCDDAGMLNVPTLG